MDTGFTCVVPVAGPPLGRIPTGGVIRDIVRKIDRSTGDRLVPMEADGLMESFEHAARRHFADAEDLADRQRLDNAGHLIGLAAECAVKHAVRHVTPNPPRIHFPELTAGIRQLGGRNPAVSKIRRALSPPAHGSVFDDWSIAMRYRADGHVEDAQYRKWKVAAGQIMSAASIERR